MALTISQGKNFIFVVEGESSVAVLGNDGQFLFRHPTDAKICSLAADASDDVLAIALSSKLLLLAHVNAGSQSLDVVKSFPLERELVNLKIVEYEGHKCAMGCMAGDLVIVDLTTEPVVEEGEKPSHPILLGAIAALTATAFNEHYVLAGDRDGRIRVSDFPDAYQIRAFCLAHEEFISGLEFLDNEKFVAVDGGGSITKWNVNGELLLLKKIFKPTTIIRSIVNTPEGLVVITDENNKITTLNKDTFEILKQTEVQGPVVNLSFSPSCGLIVATGVGIFINSTQITTINPPFDPKNYSLDSKRVEHKAIVHSGETGDVFELWRNPEKAPGKMRNE